MATVGTIAFTLAEWAKRLDPGGKIDKIVELLVQQNMILEDAMFVEGNLPTGHRTTVRTDMPSGTWRKLNYGVKPSKSKTKQVDDTCGMLEDYAEVDKALADLNGNTAEFRLSEDKAFLEGMNNTMATTMFYGDTAVNPERFLGMAARYPNLATPNVINAGGSGVDLTSIWLVVWGESTVHGIFPKGSKAGWQMQDLGEVTLEDADGGKYQGYRTHYKWDIGLTVRDWRYVVRLANVESGGVVNNLIEKPELMIELYHQPPNLSMGNAAIYCNKAVKIQFDKAAFDKGNAYYGINDVFGKPQTTFWGIPIKRCDAILNTEAALT